MGFCQLDHFQVGTTLVQHFIRVLEASSKNPFAHNTKRLGNSPCSCELKLCALCLTSVHQMSSGPAPNALQDRFAKMTSSRTPGFKHVCPVLQRAAKEIPPPMLERSA